MPIQNNEQMNLDLPSMVSAQLLDTVLAQIVSEIKHGLKREEAIENNLISNNIEIYRDAIQNSKEMKEFLSCTFIISALSGEIQNPKQSMVVNFGMGFTFAMNLAQYLYEQELLKGMVK